MTDFQSQFLAGLAANVAAAVVILIAVDLRLRTRDAKSRRSEAESIRRATLLQLFPPIMQRLIEIQRDAFRVAVGRDTAPHGEVQCKELASELRHFANIHVDTVDTLNYFGVDTSVMEAHSELTNALAIVAITLYRSQSAGEGVFHVAQLIDRLRLAALPGSKAGSHYDRICVLYEGFSDSVEAYPSQSPPERADFTRRICEIAGHNAVLLLDHVNRAFAIEVAELERLTGEPR